MTMTPEIISLGLLCCVVGYVEYRHFKFKKICRRHSNGALANSTQSLTKHGKS